ncbi:MAG: hypothetical protein ACTSRA_07720 [Promethearchaeota archaeon]
MCSAIIEDENYYLLMDWTEEHDLEGGPMILVVDEVELVEGYDTLIDHLVSDGILLWGKEIPKDLKGNKDKEDQDGRSLLDLVNSL